MHYNMRQSFSALYLRRHAKFEVAEPIHCRIIAFLAANTLLYAATLTFDPVNLIFDL